MLFAMDLCICCDVSVKCCAIFCRGVASDVTGGSQSAPVTCMFVYMIKNWHVWACRFATQSVTSWGTGCVLALNVTLRFATVGGEPWPKQGCELSLKYEINNENNFAMAATLVKRSRNEVLSLTLKKEKFVKMFFCKNDAVILILLQNRVNPINCKAIRALR